MVRKLTGFAKKVWFFFVGKESVFKAKSLTFYKTDNKEPYLPINECIENQKNNPPGQYPTSCQLCGFPWGSKQCYNIHPIWGQLGREKTKEDIRAMMRMMHNHIIVKCKECGIIIRQCRCMGEGKTIELDMCDECINKSNDKEKTKSNGLR